jgi:hypothetical protein
MYAMLSASRPLATCLRVPVVASMAKPAAIFGSPRVPTYRKRRSGLTDMGVEMPGLSMPGIGTFSTSSRSPLARSRRST